MTTNRPPRPTKGYGGKKYAYADAIEFIPVPDEAARVAGLQAGDYHLGPPISATTSTRAPGFPGHRRRDPDPDELGRLLPELEVADDGNLAMRQAVQAAFDHMPMLQSGRGGDDFIRLDPGLMMTQTPWHSTAGEEHYNVNDPDLAKAKLQEAGYDGTPLRFMTTQEYSYMYGEAIVAQAATGGGRHHRRSPGDGLGDGAGAASQAGRMGDVRHGPWLRPRSQPDLLRRPDEPVSRLVELGEQSGAGRASSRRVRIRDPHADLREDPEPTTPRFRRSRSATRVTSPSAPTQSAAGTRSSSAV